MFSVIIPLYNKELSVKNTIQTVLNQTLTEFEILIVNDGSTDDSLNIVKKIKDKRIRIINKPNGGVSSARNRGVKEAKFEWIAFLDADDLWERNHLEEFKNMMTVFPEMMVFCTSHSKSKLREAYFPKMVKGFELIEDYFDVAMKNVDFFWTGAVCIHKSVFRKTGLFPLKINRGEDLFLWGEIGKRYKIIRSQVVTVNYNYDSENKLTNSKSDYKSSIISQIDLKNLKGSERLYYKKIIFNRLKSNLKTLSFMEILTILFKNNIQLLK